MPLEAKVKSRVASGPPTVSIPYVAGPLGESMLLVDCKVATRLVVAANPIFLRPKPIVTVSPGSTTPLGQVSVTIVKSPGLLNGTKSAGPAIALIRLLPLGVPHPVQ